MSDFSESLLKWYSRNARSLPWRKFKDPYAIWVSEIMLQQTRVETVIPYFNKWMKQYPDIKTLANATERDVLLSWEGLGYYKRAINLSKASKKIVSEFDGELPGDYEKLISLPGIGKYTASAILSIAFNFNTPAIDGNIKRIISRVFNIEEDGNSSLGKQITFNHLENIKPENNVGDFNQALMDMGAAICKPKHPECDKCPLEKICKSRKIGNQNNRPVRKKKKSIPTMVYVCAIIMDGDKYLLSRRQTDGLLGGTWEYPNVKIKNEDREEKLINYLNRQYAVTIDVESLMGVYNHTYTHFKQIVYVYRCQQVNTNIQVIQDQIWIDLNEIKNYPMGKVFKNITKTLGQGKRQNE